MTALFSWFRKYTTTLWTIIKIGPCFNILTNSDNCIPTNWTSNILMNGKPLQDFTNHIISQWLQFSRHLPITICKKSGQSHYKCSLPKYEMLQFLIVKTLTKKSLTSQLWWNLKRTSVKLLFVDELLFFRTPFSHYRSFFSLLGWTLSHLVVMSCNFDSLPVLLGHFNRYTR